jgi:selenide,water dikinase
MEGVRELAERDLFPSGSRRNHAAYWKQVDWGGIPELDQLMLCDAQTSGGLLVAIPQENGSQFEAALKSSPYPAVKIGTINGNGSIRVLPTRGGRGPQGRRGRPLKNNPSSV